VPGCRYLVRLIDRPRRAPPLPRHEVVLGRGPFTVADERALLVRHRIDAIVCRASGGAATEAKILAARALALPVVMLRRPPGEPGERVETVAAALDWIAQRLDGTAARRDEWGAAQ
jgi:precorrin-6A/cobalt-precorrin-6A reductase